MKTQRTNYFVLRLALLIAPLAVSGEANAACAPASPVDNVIVTCTGTTTNANGTDGYGTSRSVSGDQGNTYNIVTGATVTGTNNGLVFFDAGTVNNSGVIQGKGVIGRGVFGTVRGTVNNTGIISAPGAGVDFNANGVVNNSGSISATGRAVRMQNGEVTNTGNGSIIGGTDGIEIVDAAKISQCGPDLGRSTRNQHRPGQFHQSRRNIQ